MFRDQEPILITSFQHCWHFGGKQIWAVEFENMSLILGSQIFRKTKVFLQSMRYTECPSGMTLRVYLQKMS